MNSLKSHKTRLKKLANQLLATTCLTLGTGAMAMAGTINEPAGGFGNAFPGTLLPAGTTTVNGTATLVHGPHDFFEFQGLTGSSSFGSLGLKFSDFSSIFALAVQLFDDTDTALTSSLVVLQNNTLMPSGTVPVDGNLIVQLTPANEGPTNYSVTLGSQTPEPASVALVGLGLGCAAVLRRRFI